LGRLACARDNQPYVVPIAYAYHKSAYGDSYLYVGTTLGQKVHWMRTNPQVCVEWDEVSSCDRWVSVVAFGIYEELPDKAEFAQERQLACELLRDNPVWWEPCWATYVGREHRDLTQPYSPLYYRIRIDEITGHRASPAPVKMGASIPPSVPPDARWLQKAIRDVTAKISSWHRRSPANHQAMAPGRHT
jgi:hypothetical protein